ENYVPMIIVAATSDKTGALRAWQHTAEQFLTKLARNDYNRAWEYLRKADPDFRLAAILLQVDTDRAVRDLIDLAVFEKGVNKVALRNVLRGYKAEVFAYIRPLYATLKTDNRVNAVRLLTLFRNDADVMQFLREMMQAEKAKKVLAIVQGQNTQKTLRVKNPDRKEIVEYFQSAMIYGVAATRERFLNELIKPPYTEVAESLFYGVYINDLLQNIVIVDRGRVLDIENRDVTLPQECTVKVLHPVELTSKTEFLKRLNITQPFAQIKRRVFVPSADDIQRGGCFGISGTVISLNDFVANMRKCGFRALSRDEDNMCSRVGLARGEILCVLRIAPVDLSAKANVSVQAQCVHFYAEKDVVRLGGKRYVEGVAPSNPSVLDPRAFSEFMYSVYDLMGCK
ncbi:MAG: DUF4132 domain-containing protein, partial [Clostridiales bacterium]|nr:DUF4132 domain-containing protein [Clostridiales bacterium]